MLVEYIHNDSFISPSGADERLRSFYYQLFAPTGAFTAFKRLVQPMICIFSKRGVQQYALMFLNEGEIYLTDQTIKLF